MPNVLFNPPQHRPKAAPAVDRIPQRFLGYRGKASWKARAWRKLLGLFVPAKTKGSPFGLLVWFCRLFETPELPPNVFPEVTKAMEEQAGSAGDVAAPDAAAASTDVAAGGCCGATHAEDRSKVPFQFAVCDIQTRAFDPENAYDRGGRRELGGLLHQLSLPGIRFLSRRRLL